jgi:ankyrin repeat protein
MHMSDDEIIPFQTPVQIAAKLNNIALLQTLLEHSASAMACPISTHPDFENLCYSQARDTKRFYPISKSNRLYRGDYWWYTALQYGTLSQNLSLVALLLSKRVSPDARTTLSVSDTPLQISAMLGNVEIFQLLWNSGADINAPPAIYNGRTAVQGAAESGDWRILRLLQRVGAQINAPAGEECGVTALQAACLSGHSLMVGFLFAHQADLYAAPSPVGGFTPIQAAAKYGDIELVKALISLGAEVDGPASGLGTNALLAAMEHQSLSLLGLLVDNGANVNSVGNHELESPLRRAVYEDWVEGVKFLLKCGAHVNGPWSGKSDDELTPLGRVIYRNSADMVDLLLQHGADVLAIVNFDGVRPLGALTYALFESSSIQILDLLFARVPDIEKHTGWEDALSLALDISETANIDFDTCKVIIEKMSPLPPLLRYKVLQNGWDTLPFHDFSYDEELLEAMALLIEAGADVDCHAKDGSTLLQRMAGDSIAESCRLLVGHGANVSTHATQSHGTPLQEALMYKNVQIAELCLEHGADVNALPAAERVSLRFRQLPVMECLRWLSDSWNLGLTFMHLLP